MSLESSQAPTDCRHSVSGTVSLPSSGCFSPFPHGTGSLSVSKEYLALVLRSSDRISRVPPYLIRPIMLPIRDCHPLWSCIPTCSSHTHGSADPRSLAATRGVSIDFLSSGYLDVSVPRVCFYRPMYSVYKYLFQRHIDYRSNNMKLSGGFPHSEIHGSKLILSSP